MAVLPDILCYRTAVLWLSSGCPVAVLRLSCPIPGAVECLSCGCSVAVLRLSCPISCAIEWLS